eukprot:COSAG05_NODE_16265_length_350_cov_0.609562_1_plen_103_part_01
MGCLMGAACRFNGFCELDLPSLVWKHLLGEQLGIRELNAADADTASHLEVVASIDDQRLWDAQAEADPVCWSVRRVDGKVIAIRGDGTEHVSFSERAEYVATV